MGEENRNYSVNANESVGYCFGSPLFTHTNMRIISVGCFGFTQALRRFGASLIIVSLVASLLPGFAPYAHAATSLFSDGFEQSGSGLTIGWTNVDITGSGDPARDSAAAVTATKGLRFDGSTGSNPDDAAERHIATKGYEALNVSFDLALANMSGDTFTTSLYLDNAL